MRKEIADVVRRIGRDGVRDPAGDGRERVG